MQQVAAPTIGGGAAEMYVNGYFNELSPIEILQRE
jgi:hypothetical protein